MTAARRGAALLLAVLAVLAFSGWTGAAAAATSAAAERVVVVGVPGLTWDDVGRRTTPQLAALADEGAIGSLSVRAARSTTCLLDGWATLGAGNRARLPGVAPTAAQVCAAQQRLARTDLTDPRAALAAVGADRATRRFGSTPAALGRSVGCAGVVGRPAALAVAGPGVRLATLPALPSTGPALAALLTACPLTVVALGGPADGTHAAALTAIDAAVGRLRSAVAALPGRSLLLVAGVSEVAGGHPQLHVGIAAGPGFAPGTWLTSAGTGRAPYVELIDVAPTALRALGLAVPPSMNGEPMRSAGDRPALGVAVRELRLAGTAAAVHYRSTKLFFGVLVAVDALLVIGGLLALGGLFRPVRGRRPAGRRALRLLCLPAAALPVAGYLADLVPWERAGDPRWALLGAVVAGDVVVAAVAAAGPWRRRPLGPAVAVLAITFGTLVADVVTGSHLELNALLGYDAIVAGRFVGYGNLSFALLSTTGLLLTAAIAAAAGRRVAAHRSRRVAAGVTVLLGVVVVGLDGAPQLGRDLGGVLSAVPAFLLLALLLTGARVSVTRIAAILAAAALVAGAVAVLDWLRPADQRTHLGRFVQQLLDGQAWTVVSRKGEANLGILTDSVLVWLLPVVLLAAVWLVRPGGLLRSGGALPGLTAGDRAALRAGLVAVAFDLALGTLVNDSGVALPATAAAVLVPLLVRLAATGGSADPARTGEGGPWAAGSRDPDRVTVGSRGSTVWNA